jgi:hypothetical protein
MPDEFGQEPCHLHAINHAKGAMDQIKFIGIASNVFSIYSSSEVCIVFVYSGFYAYFGTVHISARN